MATDLLPGIYGLDDAIITPNRQAVTFAVGRSQDDVLQRLAASQWRIISFAPGFYLMNLANRLATLRLRGNDSATVGLITAGVPVPFTMSGARSAGGTSQFLTFGGDTAGFGSPDDPADITGIWDGPDTSHALLQFSVPHKLGVQPVELSDTDAVATVFIASSSFVEAMLSMQKSGVTPDAKTYREYRNASGSAGTATITSLDPFEGTVKLTGLADADGQTINVETSFSLVAPALPKTST
jgi:hypothetical protein